MSEISEELKQAYAWARRRDAGHAVVLADAYVQAEARARIAEWKLEHVTEPFACRADDKRHDWTEGQWKAEVIRELEEKP